VEVVLQIYLSVAEDLSCAAPLPSLVHPLACTDLRGDWDLGSGLAEEA
jgi:hypothetical protein